MSFFVTSRACLSGGHLGGLAGADRQCQTLAEAAGAADRTWHAYLSTSFKGAPAANAGDRIGAGPWYNAEGVLVARGADGPAQEGRPDAGARPHRERRGRRRGDDGADRQPRQRHCGAWTRPATTGRARPGTAAAGGPGAAWNSARTAGCARRLPAGPPRLYCFALK